MVFALPSAEISCLVERVFPQHFRLEKEHRLSYHTHAIVVNASPWLSPSCLSCGSSRCTLPSPDVASIPSQISLVLQIWVHVSRIAPNLSQEIHVPKEIHVPRTCSNKQDMREIEQRGAPRASCGPPTTIPKIGHRAPPPKQLRGNRRLLQR